MSAPDRIQFTYEELALVARLLTEHLRKTERIESAERPMSLGWSHAVTECRITRCALARVRSA